MSELNEKLKKIFNAIDTSKDGLIGWNELVQCCEKLSIDLNEADKKDFNNSSSDGTHLNFDGFCSFVNSRLERIFGEIDTNHNNSLDRNEISAVLTRLGITLSFRQIDGILSSMDKNSDQKVDFNEFQSFFADIPSPNIRLIAVKMTSGEGLDYGSDIVPINIPPVEMPLIQFIMAGGVAGISSRTLTAPLEKLKIVAQVANKESTKLHHSFTRILRHEGVKGLFSGNFANCIRIFPSSALICLVYSRMIKYTPVDNKKNPNQPLWRFVSGVTAGIVSTAATHPLDVVRARLTVQDLNVTNTSNRYTGILNAFRRISTEEGVRGLYKGIRPSLLSIAPFLGIQQSTYDIMKIKAADIAMFGSQPGTFMMCGALAGMIAQTSIHPLDVVRRRMQVGIGGEKRTFVVALKHLYKEGGIPKLYAGLIASYLKVIPAAASSLLVRDFLLGRIK